MAIPEVSLLRRGHIDEWNEWRRQNADVRFDLNRCDLSGLNLSRADLTYLDLTAADFRGATLSKAALSMSTLNGAMLSHATIKDSTCRYMTARGAQFVEARVHDSDFTESDLSKTNWYLAGISQGIFSQASCEEASFVAATFRGCTFLNVNLTKSLLVGTTFIGRTLEGANFTGAVFNVTVFAGVDLSRVTGLQQASHRGPSYLTFDVMLKFAEHLPASFLRGTGMPDFARDLMRDAARQPVFYSCFISYAAADQQFVDRLYADLQSHGVRCWLDRDHMRIGDSIREALDDAIMHQDKLLLVLSSNSVASAWVEKEVESAFDRERREKSKLLLPIRLDDSVMTAISGWAADIRRTRHIGDFRQHSDMTAYQAAFARLIRDLRIPLESAG